MKIGMNKYMNDVFIGRWAEGKLSEKEKNAFEKWLTQNPKYLKDFAKYTKIIDLSGKIKLPSGMTASQRWKKLKQAIDRSSTPKSKKINISTIRNFSYLVAAATVLLAVYIWYNMDQTIRVFAPRGQQIVHQLPDGSNITLNAGTLVEYTRSGWDENRHLQLDGEAFFRIQPGTPFTVQTGNIYTRVLGTSFNINTRFDKVEVACVSGRVLVENRNENNASVILTPGLLCSTDINGSLLKPQKFNTEQKTGWMNGEFYFSNTPLRIVFSELERQFDLQIKYPETIGEQSFTGRFSNTDAEYAFEIVTLAADLDFTFESSSVVLIYSAE